MKRNLIMLFAVIFFILVFLTNTYSSEEMIFESWYPQPSGAYGLLRVLYLEPSTTPPPPYIEHVLSMRHISPYFNFQYTGSLGDGIRFTHDGSANDLVLDPTGNIGIGIDEPQSQLHINASDSEAIITLERTDMIVYNGDDIGRIDFRGGIDSTNIDTVAQIKAEADQDWGDPATNSRLVFSTTDYNGTLNERMTIDGSGDVGIGTTTPAKNLDIVEENDDFVGIEIMNTNTGSNSCEGINFGDEDGDIAFIRLYDDTNTTFPGELIFANRRTGGSINISAKEYISLGIFASSPTGYIRLDSSGNVGIGTRSPSYKLHVNGAVAGTSWTTTSDERFKNNIKTIDNSLDKVLDLRGVEFEWRRDEFKDKNFSEGKQIGLIAQEVEKVLPELVSEDSDGYKSLAYANIVALLIEAIKEQQEKIEALEEKINQINQYMSR